MSRRRFAPLRVLLAALVAFAVLGGAARADAPNGESYVVVLAPGVAPSAATGELEREVGFRARHRYGHALAGFAASLDADQVAELRADPAVATVAPDVEFTLDAAEPLVPGETLPDGVRRIRAASAERVPAAGDAGVAVLDTGIDLDQPDLAVAGGVNCVDPGAAPDDDHGHGTHVAGIIGARNGGEGVVGVAPGARLFAVKVVGGDGSGGLSQILCGIDWVTANAAALDLRVANMSLSARGESDGGCATILSNPEHAAICRSVAAGVTWVASAGNDDRDLARSTPAAYPEVLAVTAATDTDGRPGGWGERACERRGRDDEAAWYSNFAVRDAELAHTLAAPGTCVLSTRPGGGTATGTGTSQAAPHVAGAVVRCHGSTTAPGPCAGLAPADVRERILRDAERASLRGWGFDDDPFRRGGRRQYGFLVSVAGY